MTPQIDEIAPDLYRAVKVRGLRKQVALSTLPVRGRKVCPEKRLSKFLIRDRQPLGNVLNT
jgi:hypothetical protein